MMLMNITNNRLNCFAGR